MHHRRHDHLFLNHRLNDFMYMMMHMLSPQRLRLLGRDHDLSFRLRIFELGRLVCKQALQRCTIAVVVLLELGICNDVLVLLGERLGMLDR